MTTWRHTDRCDCADHADHCGSLGCLCADPTPDPASPCGLWGCGQAGGAWCHSSSTRDKVPASHRHVPTRCLSCGHPIEATR